jgi:hypothetical protein
MQRAIQPSIDRPCLLDTFKGSRPWREHLPLHRDGRINDLPDGFVPQNGGSYETDHRCPGGDDHRSDNGERELLMLAMRYHVPAQDFLVDLTRIPTLPNGRICRARY